MSVWEAKSEEGKMVCTHTLVCRESSHTLNTEDIIFIIEFSSSQGKFIHTR